MLQYLDIPGQLNSIKIISPVSFYFTRKFKIIYVVCMIFVLDNASLEH